CGFNRTYKMMSATKVAPPKNMQNHKRFHVSLRASVTSAAINKQRIPSEHSKTFDCFADARNDR
ncbi:MAG: hypothetical protein K2N20_00335, partial [Helicobacter sp.]|nr:hypothetical protein [Helicobacter sp.]